MAVLIPDAENSIQLAVCYGLSNLHAIPQVCVCGGGGGGGGGESWWVGGSCVNVPCNDSPWSAHRWVQVPAATVQLAQAKSQ